MSEQRSERPAALDPYERTQNGVGGSQNVTQRALQLDYVSQPWATTDRLPDRQQNDDEYVDKDQLAHVDKCLADVPYLINDLEIAFARQDRFPNRPIMNSDGTESPLPFREGAAETTRKLQYAVWGVAGLIWHRTTGGQPNPFRSANESAQWLRSSLRVFALDPDAEQYARRISDVHQAALDGPIARPPDWQYLGACDACGDDLEAEPGAETVQCPCGWTDDVRAVIDRALEATQDMLFTDTQLVGALELDGKIVTRAQIRRWYLSGRLTAHESKRWSTGHRAAHAQKIITVRTFRLSEVRGLVAQLEAARSR